ncbi:hAT family C-terminal dimerization domain containing protein [Nitzschia inconspicua]|uniref:HAT family C-terminal dimerization domain containing protein n=1 Tax=Nitzschia inconspicua TaxID=303405 RepID=A0A9K3LSW7_9STRA|nr:hAT family C-terminal dimerization domain containing protein [Nitzschia inconspicua]
MSQPNHSSEINPRASDEASALSVATTDGCVPGDRETDTAWLRPSEAAAALFELEKGGSKRASNPVWNFFHRVKRAKPGVPDEKLPLKWLQYGKKRSFMACNGCGELVVAATFDPKNMKKFKAGSVTAQGMLTHLQSTKHSTTPQALQKLVGLPCSAPLPKKQSSITSWSKSGPNNLTSKEEQAQQDLAVTERITTTHQPLNPHSTALPKMQSSITSWSKFGPHKLTPEEEQAQHELAVTKWITTTHQPLDTVENPAFCRMIASLNKKAKPMTKHRIKRTISILEDYMREASIKSIEGKSVSLTLNHWTSDANQNYTGITAYFIDDEWKLGSKSLGIFLHEEGATGDDLEQSFLDLYFQKLKNCGAKIFAVTTDTTYNMNNFGIKMEELGEVHCYCTDHLFQLTCKLCYEKGDDLGEQAAESIKKARAIVTFINESSQALENLKTKQRVLERFKGKIPKGVVAEIVTRWWSTLAMVERLLELKEPIDLMFVDSQLGDCQRLEGADWDNLKLVAELLKPFKEAQKMLEGDTYVTASMVPLAVKKLRGSLMSLASPENSTTSRPFAQALLRDFEDRWRKASEPTFVGVVQQGTRDRQVGIHPALLIANFLDPRFKNIVPDLDSVCERFKAILLELVTKNREANGPVAVVTAAAAASTDNEEMLDKDVDEDVFADIEAAQALAEQGRLAAVGAGGNIVESLVEDEMQWYKSFPPLPLRKTLPGGIKVLNDPLKWWQEMAAYFPILASLAKAYLALQATSAPSEKIFSMALQLSERGSFDPELDGKMLFVAENWDLHEEHLLDALLAAAEQEEEEGVCS